jgi:hypothetical protein
VQQIHQLSGSKLQADARRLIAATARGASSAAGSSSGSDSDSDTDPVARLGIDPSEVGPNGELPWYYNDLNVKAAWRIEDQQELEHWREVAGRVQR